MRGSNKARQLRRDQTDAEAKLWWHVRGRRLGGHKFRRQFPVGPYIVDFICIERRLVVELDGGQHLDQRVYDRRRTMRLQALGMTVARYWNDDVLLRIDDVLHDIAAALAAPHPNPLPACGERARLS